MSALALPSPWLASLLLRCPCVWASLRARARLWRSPHRDLSPLVSHTAIASLLGNGNHLFRSPAQTSPRNSIHLTTSFMPPPDVANKPSTQRDPNRTRTFIQTPSPNESHSRNPFSISIHRTTAHFLIQTYGSSLPIFLPHAPCQHFTYFKVFP